MKNILVLGSLNMDLVTSVQHTPKIGETIFGDKLAFIPGGKGANQAVALGKLGANVEIIGMIGGDEYGEILRKNLNKFNVLNNNILYSKNNTTGIAFIMVNNSGDNSIVVISGANEDFKSDRIKNEWFINKDIVVSQLEIPIETVNEAFSLAKQNGCYTVLNPAPALNLPDSLLRNTDIIIPNETEFEILTGIRYTDNDDIIEGSKILFDKGVKEILVTLGEKGAIYLSKERVIQVNSYMVDAVDTTAAGDSFIAGVVFYISIGKNIEEALEFASKVAAITVSRKGAQTSLASFKEVEKYKGVKRA
ncbi:ribokinase [Helicovermis profundi]|uniref:Ribokinase n=1 Tax=Helicovermis profundi TaxID=3065157 RepID=A0AAU9E278_9FIRM|nr:ribokinase [Clostridia bacterium S502]